MGARNVFGTPDAENPEWTAAEIAAARPFPAVDVTTIRRHRGPQKAPTKRLVSLRIDPDVLQAYRATGKGWQARINDTLSVHAPRRKAKKRSRA